LTEVRSGAENEPSNVKAARREKGSYEEAVDPLCDVREKYLPVEKDFLSEQELQRQLQLVTGVTSKIRYAGNGF
jgi:hypothetical protein